MTQTGTEIDTGTVTDKLTQKGGLVGGRESVQKGGREAGRK